MLDTPETPGGCWAHYSMIQMDGFARLESGQSVELTWESARQDGYNYRAVQVWPN